MWRGKRVAKVPLSIESMKSLKTALSDVVKGNKAPELLLKERKRICETCPHGGKRCDMCGCFIQTKITLLNSKCPINKW